MRDLSVGASEPLIELVLVALLIATLFHAVRLERALGRLRRDRAALETLMGGFYESAKQAEGGVERLRLAADGVGRQLVRQVDLGQTLKNDLETLLPAGERLADKLAGLIQGGKEAKRVEQPNLDRNRMTQVTVPEANRGGHRQAQPASETRFRSQAEKDLLLALRLKS